MMTKTEWLMTYAAMLDGLENPSITTNAWAEGGLTMEERFR
jgi:hypothetical protein